MSQATVRIPAPLRSFTDGADEVSDGGRPAMKASQRRLLELKSQVGEVDVHQALELQQEGAILIDVREPDEVAAGSPVAAERIVRGFLELRIEERVADFDQPLLVMCAGGARSLFAGRDWSSRQRRPS